MQVELELFMLVLSVKTVAAAIHKQKISECLDYTQGIKPQGLIGSCSSSSLTLSLGAGMRSRVL